MPTILFDARFRSAVLALAPLLLLLPLAGCGLAGRSAPPVDRTQDGRIQQELRDRLVREPAVDAETIRVEVDGRTVLLYGSVRGLAAWRCAIRNAELVPGVSNVVDYLLLERGPRDAPCLAPRAAEPTADP